MTITRLALLFALLSALLVAGCGGDSEAGDVPEGAVAVVDGTEISRTDFDKLIEQAKRSYKSQNREFPKAGTDEYQTLQNQAVAALVQKVELEQAAEAQYARAKARLLKLFACSTLTGIAHAHRSRSSSARSAMRCRPRATARGSSLGPSRRRRSSAGIQPFVLSYQRPVNGHTISMLAM